MHLERAKSKKQPSSSEEASLSDHAPQSNGRWSDEEHDRFIQALKMYGKDWSKVHKYVGTRSSAQTRSHA
jgi:SHAQKYF class myb-like DNA-binding protein